MNVTAVLFDGFETLDVFGPVEMLGASGEFQIAFYSLEGGIVTSNQGVPVETQPLSVIGAPEVLLVPGGMGVYDMLENEVFIKRLAELANQAKFVLSVCNGAFLYAKAGVFDGRRATTYKARMGKAEELFPAVNWERNARWTVDGNLYVSSGVSAGTDMALGFIADVCGRDVAEKTARYAEYTWNADPSNDPFAC
ncbi:MAG: DJ-1/PfpI family protein [Eggerthellaceae bacterium]|nr:DJ-1/PfpI family protein [Eggerthellaceae bacterium]